MPKCTYEPIAASDVPFGLRWNTPLRNQGQTIEVSFADVGGMGDADEGAAYRRTIDRSEPPSPDRAKYSQRMG